jgi:N-methylhydantoinase A
MTRILVPPSPGTLCALGAMIADLKADYIRSTRLRLAEVTDELLRQTFSDLERQARAWLDGERADVQQIDLVFSADMRYVGQAFHIEVALPGDVARLSAEVLAREFQTAYADLYGAAQPNGVIETVNMRARITGKRGTFRLRRLPKAPQASPEPVGRRTIRYAGAFHEANVFRRDDLLAGHRLEGPAIVEQFDTTTVVAPGFQGEVDHLGVLMLTRIQQ